MQRKDHAKQNEQQRRKAEGTRPDDRAGARRPAERSEEGQPNAAPPPTAKPGDV
jgi:hypothetical protein